MKKTYLEPVVAIIQFSDVITGSGGMPDDGETGGNIHSS